MTLFLRGGCNIWIQSTEESRMKSKTSALTLINLMSTLKKWSKQQGLDITQRGPKIEVEAQANKELTPIFPFNKRSVISCLLKTPFKAKEYLLQREIVMKNNMMKRP